MSVKEVGPGPAKYALPTTVGFVGHDPRKERKPMYSMRSLPKQLSEPMTPGPAKYGLGKITRTGGPREVKYSMAGRLQPLKQDLAPGPGAHNNHLVPAMNCKRAPQYSIGARIDIPSKDIVPGPNRYTGAVDMTRPTAPCYSIRGQTKEILSLDGPGPAKYNLANRNITHNRLPSYSIRGAYKPLAERNPHPGPNRYGCMNLQMDRTAPSYSFGIRYPHWQQPMIVPGDNC